ncbi:MAG: chemotaxis protein CheA [Lachnospiraceae bacterium]|nr:chemotaxis protein CheA [Lachnospiraceae bacterium]MBO4461266.1 chemotaxis protein CheA [Lachnospiraceae bacterium]MBR4795012.1 chemotaxis protein CheA [Lachnospiraceae bacterium]MBR5788479.1 chemotaxis protein CheA [Lachnospiraceae bacterium]
MDVSQYLEIFIDETSEHIQSLNDCIMNLEQEPDNKDTINEIFRAAHSLKGMAGTMGFKRMQHLTHDMENVFSEVRNDKVKVNGEMIDVLFQCLDAIEGYLETIKSTSDEGTEENEAIITKLNEILNNAGGAAAPAPAKEEAHEEKAPESAAPSNFEEKFLDAEFNDADKQAVKAKEAEGLKVYGVTVYIDQKCLLKSARAFLVFKAIEEIGTIIYYNPSSQDIEDEKFDFDFNLFVATDRSLDEILNAAKNVLEIETAVGREISSSDLDNEAGVDMSKEDSAGDIKNVPQVKTQQATSGGKAPANKQAVTSRTVRVDIEKLDTLMNQVSELIIAKNSLVSISSAEGAGGQSQSFTEQIEYLERITTMLHESVMKARMVPIESVVNKFPRMIRDLSKTLNKKMELVMTGEETELDRTVVDQIGDPLQHLLRNSADHGLEPDDVRIKRGKPETGKIFLNAYQEGNNVVIEVGDDGNGIDTQQVKQKAIERGLVTADQADTLSQKEIIDFLFMPGFSMAKKVSDISGRGVGLDVVKSNIEALGGDVEVKSTLGEGSKFIVRLPLTLAIIQALMVEIEDEKYAIALGSIQNIEDIPASDVKYVQAKEVITLRGSVIPLIRLDKMLDVERKDPEAEENKTNLTVVIVKKGDNFAGLVVDRLMGQQEIVIKSLGKYINNNKMISGATILGDGEVALILDANTLI